MDWIKQIIECKKENWVSPGSLGQKIKKIRMLRKYTQKELVCIPSSRQLKKYKIFVLPGWISGNIFMPPIVAFHEIPLVLRLQVLSVAGRLYSNLYIL